MYRASAPPPLPILTSLRFFAAAEVVLYHLWHFGEPSSIVGNILVGLISWGYQAVTFFFVLSGFILVYVYARRDGHSGMNVSSFVFWRARFARLAPAYFFSLAIILPSQLYGVFVSKIIPLKTFIIGGLLVPVFLQAWWPPVAQFWNYPAWSLSVEAFFYGFFPLFMMAWRLHRPKRDLIMAYALVVAMTTLRWALAPTDQVDVGNWHLFVACFPVFHLPLFIFGMALGYFSLRGPVLTPQLQNALFRAGVLGVLMLFGGWHWSPPWTHSDPILIIIFGLLVLGGAQSKSPFALLAAPATLLLGEASYAIYLLHFPIRFWWTWLTQKQLALGLPAPLDMVGYLALVLLVSVFTFRFVERPLRRRILGHREHKDA